jgi:hypothetical protein
MSKLRDLNFLEDIAHSIASGCSVDARREEIIASAAFDLRKVLDLPPRTPELMAEAMLVQHLCTVQQLIG